MDQPTSNHVTTAVAMQERAHVEDLDVDCRALAWWPSLMLAAALGLALVGIAFSLHGKPLAEKTIIALVLPVGFAWLLLSGRALHLLLRRRWSGSKMVFLMWLALSIAGTRPLGEAVLRYLETSAPHYNPMGQPPLDAVVVLGGGTSHGSWRAQVGGAGDRVVLAAELFHLGLAKRLVTTGQATAGVSKKMIDPSEDTIEIWTSLGIPRAAISKLGGRNTSEELASLKQSWSKFAGKRVALITSANHLPRAIRLARDQGLDVIPIAADVQWTPTPWGLLDFIPSAGTLEGLARNQHELMAAWVGR